jgi:phosphoglycolate phosphatase
LIPTLILYLFDIDGTLLHAHGSGRAAFDAVFAEQHALTNASEGIRYGGKTDPQIVDEIFQARFGRRATTAEIDAFLDAYIPRLRGLLAANRVVVIDGVREALQALANTPGVVMGLATGNIKRGAYEKMVAADLTSWFEPGDALLGCVGGYGCDSAVRAELVARAIARGRERGATGEVIVVGDTIHDISAARACHATVVAVTTGADPADKLAHADTVMTSLAELPAWHAQRFG